MSKPKQPIEIIQHQPKQISAIGGAIEGAEMRDRETVNWIPAMGSADRIINPVKELADARGRDMAQNDGYVSGATSIHQDNIVGSQFRLNSQPNWRALGVSEEWAEEFQTVVESRFNLISDSEDNWLDASRRSNLTAMVRLAIATFFTSGEVLGVAEWIRESRRPFKTAIQLISPDRLSNPNDVPDDTFLRRGIRIDSNGKPLVACIRKAHPRDVYYAGFQQAYEWAEVPFEKPWGRKQVIHIMERRMPDQNRGISEMVAVLKQMKMTKKFQDITLQNAVVNASYAAAVESELPSADVFTMLGGGATDPMTGLNTYLSGYMGMLATYLDASKNISIDGAKIPHLFPGTKLNLKPVGTPGGVGTGFEQGLLRHIAAALGLSYEQFSRDYSNTNYSSARASMNETWKFMQSRKKSVADRFATNIFALWLEEEITAGNIPLPAGKTAAWFYEPMVKDALIQCTWIGASRGQIDEVKETQSALMRMNGSLSTLEMECAKLGLDYRTVISQRAREKKMMEDAGLDFKVDTTKASVTNSGQSNNQTNNGSNEDEEL